jgi:hypothetical protein
MLLGNMPVVFASADFEPTTQDVKLNSDDTLSGQTLQSAFENIPIRSCEYVYNLDESADYIYVEFESGGYALFANETMEMMEYSLQESLPYQTNSKKYYAGSIII